MRHSMKAQLLGVLPPCVLEHGLLDVAAALQGPCQFGSVGQVPVLIGHAPGPEPVSDQLHLHPCQTSVSYN